MGKFEKQLEARKEKKEQERTRRGALGKFYFDLAKLVFAALVLGGMLSLFKGEEENVTQTPLYIMMILGCVATIIFALIGNKILK